jgi:hypothetical protein
MFATRFMPVSCLICSSTLKTEVTCPPKRRFNLSDYILQTGLLISAPTKTSWPYWLAHNSFSCADAVFTSVPNTLACRWRSGLVLRRPSVKYQPSLLKFSFFIIWGGGDWVHFVRRPPIGKIGRENRSTRRKPAAVPVCPQRMPHDLTWDRTRAAAVGSRRLTAWAMARPYWSIS